MRTVSIGCFVVLCLAAWTGASAQELDSSRVYRCPDNSYTNMLSVVRQKHCTPVDNANISVLSPNPAPRSHPSSRPTRHASGPDQVSPGTQNERDTEARQLLLGELQTEQARLDDELKAYNNGQPERLGDERNYQKYLDRVQSMKQQIDLTRANIEALQRELQRYSH